MSDLIEILHHNLKRIRQQRKVTYRHLERSTGIPAARLQEAEDGVTQLTVDELDRLLAYYRMTLDQVLKYKRFTIWKLAVPVLAAGLLSVTVWLAAGQGDHDKLAADPTVLADGSGTGVDAGTGDGVGITGNGNTNDGEGTSDMNDDTPQGVANGGSADGSGDHAADGGVGGEAADGTGGSAVDEVGGDHGAGGKSSSDERDANGTGDAAALTDEDTADRTDDEAEGSGGAQSGDSGGLLTSDGEPIKPVRPEDDVTVPPLVSPVYEDEVLFRFWGNIDYTADQLPRLAGNDQANVKHIIPVERLSVERPEWLDDAAADRFILNIGTADIWTDSTLTGWLSLRQDGYPVIGMGRLAEVYDPYIVEVQGRKIGFLSLAGLIHEAEHIAQPRRIGLPRAYDNLEVKQAVEQAKSQVDTLFVLLHAGYRRGDANPIDKQIRLARVAAQAGADYVIGNRSLRSQRTDAFDDVPVWYSLGRSVSEAVSDGIDNVVIDVHVTDGVDKIVVHVGVMQDGVLRFDSEVSDPVAIEARFAALLDKFDHIELDWDG